MKTAVPTSTVQIIVPTQSSAFSQEPIQDANTPFELFVTGGLFIGGLGFVIATTIGGLVFAIAKRCCVRPWRLPLGEAQIATTNYTKRRRRRLVHQSLGRTHNVGSSNRHSRPHSNSYRHSHWSSDSDSSCIIYNSSGSESTDNSSSCSSYDSSPSSWSLDSTSSCSSYDSSPSSWSSDSSSSCTSYDSSANNWSSDSSPNSWSSDSSSSCTSHDSSSSSSFGGGSSDCGGAGSHW